MLPVYTIILVLLCVTSLLPTHTHSLTQSPVMPYFSAATKNGHAARKYCNPLIIVNNTDNKKVNKPNKNILALYIAWFDDCIGYIIPICGNVNNNNVIDIICSDVFILPSKLTFIILPSLLLFILVAVVAVFVVVLVAIGAIGCWAIHSRSAETNISRHIIMDTEVANHTVGILVINNIKAVATISCVYICV